MHHTEMFPFIYQDWTESKIVVNDITFEEFGVNRDVSAEINEKLVQQLNILNKFDPMTRDVRPDKMTPYVLGPYEMLKFLTKNDEIQSICKKNPSLVIHFSN
jgi:hypothetical protein